MTTITDIIEAVAAIAPRYDIRAAYLFGSFARGDAAADSDIDVRLECGKGVGYGELLDIQEELESALGRPVEIVTNPLEFMRPAFRQRIQRDEVPLYAAA